MPPAKPSAPRQSQPPPARPSRSRRARSRKPKSKNSTAGSRRAGRSRRPNSNSSTRITLLVAVVLSAQATDVGVNRATPALFAVADTPQKMLDLGEERSKEFIRTIGLYRTKAGNIIKLSRILIDDHGGEVPRQREALENLPGVGRKTANVVLNVAFGEPTIAVDTHIFRVGNRTGLAPGKTPLEVERGLEAVTPRAVQARRASLADPARPLCLQGAQARVPGLRRCSICAATATRPRRPSWSPSGRRPRPPSHCAEPKRRRERRPAQ